MHLQGSKMFFVHKLLEMSSIPNKTKITNEACGINIGVDSGRRFDTQSSQAHKTK